MFDNNANQIALYFRVIVGPLVGGTPCLFTEIDNHNIQIES